MKSEVKYCWALDGKDCLIHIKDVVREARDSGEFGTFHCPGCGKQMIAALGEHNQHYFAHFAQKRGCGTETYLHGLMKLRLKERFDSKDSFYISLLQPSLCRDYQTCPFYSKDACSGSEYHEYNLHKIYDTCSIEEKVLSPDAEDGYYIADVLLTNSAGKYPPMLFEVFVTHEIGEKKGRSGLLVVEMHIRNEEDIEAFLTSPIKELDAHGVTKVGKDRFALFYGPFKRNNHLSKQRMNKKPLVRAVVEEYGAYCTDIEDNIECADAHKRISTTSLLEMNFDPGEIRDWYRGNPARMAHVYALDHGIYFRPELPLSKYAETVARASLHETTFEVID